MISERVFIAFGANLAGPAGKPVQTFEAAAALLAGRGVFFEAISTLYVSAPWGGIRQPSFFNGVWEVRTFLTPVALIGALLDVERQLGRRRRVRWGPRVIDLDLLVFGDKSGVWSSDKGQSPDLELPHPRMNQRAFVLLPLAEIAPTLRPWGPLEPSVAEMAARLPVRERLTIQKSGRYSGPDAAISP